MTELTQDQIAELGKQFIEDLLSDWPQHKSQTIDVPDFRQKDNYDCGAAATHSVAAYWGVGAQTEDELIQALGTNPQNGTSAEAIENYLTQCGLMVEAREGMTLEDLAEATSQDCPVICAIQEYGTDEQEAHDKSGHWVVVTGIDQDGTLTIQDPSAGKLNMTGEEFADNWHDQDQDGTELVRFGIVAMGVPDLVSKAIQRTALKKKIVASKPPDALEQVIRAFFRKQAKHILSHLPALKAKADTFDQAKWAAEMAKDVMPTAKVYYDHAAKQAAISLVGKEHTTTKLADGRKIQFTKNPRDRGILVMVDPKKLDRSWSKDQSHYIPPGGGGGEIGGRRQGFKDFLRKKEPVEASRVYLNNGHVQFDDGRHRFSVLRDEGAPKVGVMVPRDQVKDFAKKFGATVADPFGVVQPNLDKALQKAVMAFCKETQETTSKEINRALDDLRSEIAEGLERGEVKNQMMERVKGVFDRAENDRAWRIAVTEASRGQHQAAIMTAQETGLKLKKVWLLSSDACPECQPLAGKSVGLEDNFAIEGTGPYSHISAPPLHPHCLLGETPVLASGAIGAMKAYYSGPIVTIVFRSGDRISCTPNHMLLTPTGFARASQLVKGDNIISCSVRNRGFGCHPDDYRQPTEIEQVVTSLAKSSGMSPVSVPVSPEYLHGDAAFCKGNIDIVRSDCLLRHNLQTQHCGQPTFIRTTDDGFSLSPKSTIAQILKGLVLATDGGMGSLRESQSLLWRSPAHSHNHAFASVPGDDPRFQKSCHDGLTTYAKSLRQCFHRFAGLMTTDYIVDVQVNAFHGMVYDLNTTSTLYLIGNGHVSSNCRCDMYFETED